MYESILQTIGRTPLVRLNRINPRIHVKMESANPGGSVKDRISLAMIETAEKEGRLKPGDTIVEPTSGNTGIGLAMVAAVKGYRIILTMPESMTVERRKLLKAYGAEIILTPADRGMTGAVEKAGEIAREKGYFQPMQFDNPANPEVHRQTTAREILDDLGRVDILVAGVGTGGTITGVGEVLKETFKDVRVVAVEPEDSPVLSGGKPGRHKIQGIGAGFVPKILNTKIYDEVIRVRAADAVAAARLLARREGIIGGISAGANVHVAMLEADRHPAANVVTVICDTGERYLSTDLFEES
jgi:cysteine synthase A